MLVDPRHHRHFVIRRGQVLREIAEEYGGVMVSFPRSGTQSDRVTLKGAKDCVEAAKKRIQEIIEDLVGAPGGRGPPLRPSHRQASWQPRMASPQVPGSGSEPPSRLPSPRRSRVEAPRAFWTSPHSLALVESAQPPVATWLMMPPVGVAPSSPSRVWPRGPSSREVGCW